MTILEAHRLLAVPGRPRQPFAFPVLLKTDDGETVDGWPAVAVALPSLSGGLEDATTDEELDDAVRHGASLLDMEIITFDTLHAEARMVMETFLRVGYQMATAHLRN